MRRCLPNQHIARVLFCFVLVLDGFIKKMRKTPDAEMSLALKPQRERSG
jgi:hypothetical protein